MDADLAERLDRIERSVQMVGSAVIELVSLIPAAMIFYAIRELDGGRIWPLLAGGIVWIVAGIGWNLRLRRARR